MVSLLALRVEFLLVGFFGTRSKFNLRIADAPSSSRAQDTISLPIKAIATIQGISTVMFNCLVF
jgi:hypothetical protein